MAVQINEILKRLERGELDSNQALQAIETERQADEVYNNHFLHVRVTSVTDDRPRVNIRIPLRMLKTGLDIGAIYAPELRDLDLHRVIRDLHALADGSIVEIEDYESDERILIALEKMEDR